MKLKPRTVISLAVALAGIGLFCYGLYHVVKIGTCASGGAYDIARPCPSGTGGYVGMLTGGLVAAIIGMIASGASGAGSFLFSALFLAAGGTAITMIITGAAKGGARLGVLIIGVIFIPMGLGPLVLALLGRRKGSRTKTLVAEGKKGTGTIINVQDTGVTINNNPRVKLTFRIKPTDEPIPEFEATKSVTVSRVSIPRMGETFPVWYDADDHKKFVFGIPRDADAQEAVKEFVAQAKGGGTATDLTSSLAELRKSLGDAKPAGHDPLDQLKELAELHSQGALTDAEFEQQKAKLLAKM